MIDSPFALLGVMALVVSTPLLLRRLRTPQAGALRIVSRTAVTRSTALAVVAYGQRQWLVGGSEQGIQLLADLSGDSTTPTTSASTDFATQANTLARSAPVTDDRPTHALDGIGSSQAPGLGSSTRPRIGLLDLLREKTIRTHSVGRPPRVHRRS